MTSVSRPPTWWRNEGISLESVPLRDCDWPFRIPTQQKRPFMQYVRKNWEVIIMWCYLRFAEHSDAFGFCIASDLSSTQTLTRQTLILQQSVKVVVQVGWNKSTKVKNVKQLLKYTSVQDVCVLRNDKKSFICSFIASKVNNKKTQVNQKHYIIR